MKQLSNVLSEFATVDALLRLESSTRTVDAYCLSWIKFERQIRRLLVRTLRQASVFDDAANGGELDVVNALSAHKDLSFDKVFRAIEKLSGYSVWHWLSDERKKVDKRLRDIQWDRNRIFHGKQTGKSKDAKSLLSDIEFVRNVCEQIADGARRDIGYDGFERNAWRSIKNDALRKSVDGFVGSDWKGKVARF